MLCNSHTCFTPATSPTQLRINPVTEHEKDMTQGEHYKITSRYRNIYLCSNRRENGVLFLQSILWLSNSLAFEALELSLTFIPSVGLYLPLSLQLGYSVGVLPADFRRESKMSGWTRVGTTFRDQWKGVGVSISKLWEQKGQPCALLCHKEGGFRQRPSSGEGHEHPFERKKSERKSTYSVKLVGEHSSDGLPEDLRWGSEVERSLLWVGSSSLTQVDQELVY